MPRRINKSRAEDSKIRNGFVEREKSIRSDINTSKTQIDKSISVNSVPDDEINKQPTQAPLNPQAQYKYLRGFVMMSFGKERAEQYTADKETQDQLFQLLTFALNDAYFQNRINNSIRTWKPIKLERADIGAGKSSDLLDNALRKIDRSDFCIVEYTYDNLNVALEHGYAMARDKFIIPICRELPGREAHDTPRVSDLSGKLMHSVSLEAIRKHSKWKKLTEVLSSFDIQYNQPNFFEEHRELHPFSSLSEKATRTFLIAAVNKILGGAREAQSEWWEIEEFYRKDILRPLYSAIRPLYEKLESGATEVEFQCTAYAGREAANLHEVFRKATDKIRILTTNLQGLVPYIEDILSALKSSEQKTSDNNKQKRLEVEVLTLNPDSEFVNSRGQLIGKEIARFREEMKESLQSFRDGLWEKGDFVRKQVAIKQYSEFPTQITYFVDGQVFSSVVSVNHQSRNNIMFCVPHSRKGVAESFIQHWDTIWARASEVKIGARIQRMVDD